MFSIAFSDLWLILAGRSDVEHPAPSDRKHHQTLLCLFFDFFPPFLSIDALPAPPWSSEGSRYCYSVSREHAVFKNSLNSTNEKLFTFSLLALSQQWLSQMGLQFRPIRWHRTAYSGIPQHVTSWLGWPFRSPQRFNELNNKSRHKQWVQLWVLQKGCCQVERDKVAGGTD